MIHLLEPEKFIENEINPITQMKYDDNWAVFVLTDSKDYNKFVGRINGGAYTIKFSRYVNEDWRMDYGISFPIRKHITKTVFLCYAMRNYKKRRIVMRVITTMKKR